jgi:hypothetical protein
MEGKKAKWETWENLNIILRRTRNDAHDSLPSFKHCEFGCVKGARFGGLSRSQLLLAAPENISPGLGYWL